MSEALEILKSCDAFLEGHFLLSSGRHSSAYCQMAYLQQYPDRCAEVMKAVADQIKKLAEQSNQSSAEIEEITRTLMDDSSKSVEIMQQMKEIMTSQSESMQDTQSIVSEVLGEIGRSMHSIEQIKGSTKRLESSRNEVVQAVDELSEIAEDNVNSTRKTYDETQEVVDTF